MDVCSSSCFRGTKLSLIHSLQNKSSSGVYKISRVSCRASKVAAGESTLNFEQVLSVDNSSNSNSLNDIKRAYRIMALKYHPDVCDSSRREESARIFIELHNAYKHLLGHPNTENDCVSKLDSTRSGGRGISRERWEMQLQELKRRSSARASGMRDQAR